MKEAVRLWTSFLCYTVSTSMSAPLIGLQAYRLGATSSEIGIVYGLAAMTTFLTRLPLASLQSRIGSRHLIRVGVITNSASLLTYALSPTIHYMYLASCLRGVGFASFHPPALSEAVRLSRDGRQLGWVMTSPPMGMTLGPILSSSLLGLLSESLDQGQAYGVVFLVGASLSGIAFFAPSEGVDSGDGGEFDSARFYGLFSKEFMLLVFSRLMVSYVVGAVTAVLPVYLVERRIMSEPEVPLLFAWASIFNVMGRPLSSFLRAPIRGLMASSILIILMGLLILRPSLFALYVGMSLYGLSLGLFIPSSLLMVQSINPNSSLTLRIALMTLAIDLGSGIGSSFTGILREYLETEVALACSAILCGILSLVMTQQIIRREY
ncbi:MAG: MFS transporter [Nitrososphaerota archaeon]|nr:MFS transporter [Candidatus Calditenuaceae archaeon]MDW8073055.1 MFS transporter [Nitrososphaerota archaeon]